jgi:hypothetical protein
MKSSAGKGMQQRVGRLEPDLVIRVDAVPARIVLGVIVA